jgi:hypothetical protein
VSLVTESLPPEDPRDALIREQAERLAEQDEQIAGHEEQIAALEALVAELREQLDAALRAASRNSGNSSMPGPARHPRLHRHRKETRPRRLRSPAPAHGRQPLAAASTADIPITPSGKRTTNHPALTGVNAYQEFMQLFEQSI